LTLLWQSFCKNNQKAKGAVVHERERYCPPWIPDDVSGEHPVFISAVIDLSASHMELDVHLSKDGIPVVMHDHTIDRMCNGKGRVMDYTVDELKQFRVAESERIPTLEEVLRFARGRITTLIELKQTGRLYPDLELKVFEVVDKLDMADQVIISSFDHYALVRMREINPDVDICLLMGGSSPCVFPFMKDISAHYMSIPHAFLTQEYAEECMVHHVQLIVRPIDTEESMNKMLDFPSVLTSTNRWGLWKQFYETHVVPGG